MAKFGTSGIRDLAPSIVSPGLAQQVGALIAKPGRPVVVGWDGRRTGAMLKAALASGAAGGGSEVLDIGLCATPTLAWFAQEKGAMGAMITASHNPPEYNGIKLFSMGREMPKEEERRIETALEKKQMPSPVAWDSVGSVSERGTEAKAAHLELLLSKIDVNAIRKRKPKVVVDCANAAGCALMPQALREAGCEVEVLNGTAGEPYGRVLEPNEKSLGALGDAVRQSHADLGIAHDGDADRAIILDENGKMLGLDVQLALAVKEQLAGAPAASTIVSTVESSLALREMVEGAHAKLDITPVGSLHVAARMRSLSARFGGEPCGEYLFTGGVGVPDGLMAGLFFVQMFCKNGKLGAQASKIPSYPVGREKLACANAKKGKAMQAIANAWPFGKPSTLDGLRSDTPDGWVLVRPSGTEPYVRITAEAKNEKKLAEMLSAIRPLVKKACG